MDEKLAQVVQRVQLAGLSVPGQKKTKRRKTVIELPQWEPSAALRADHSLRLSLPALQGLVLTAHVARGES